MAARNGDGQQAEAALRTALAGGQLGDAGRSEGVDSHHPHRRQIETQRQPLSPLCSAVPLAHSMMMAADPAARLSSHCQPADSSQLQPADSCHRPGFLAC